MDMTEIDRLYKTLNFKIKYIKELQDKVNELKRWKEESIKYGLDAQKIGFALNLPVGTQVTTELVCSKLRNLKHEAITYQTKYRLALEFTKTLLSKKSGS